MSHTCTAHLAGTRDELQHLHDRYKQTGRYSHLLALAADATGHPCGTHGYGAATRQEHRLTAHPPLTGRYVCAECHARHATAEAADRCGR